MDGERCSKKNNCSNFPNECHKCGALSDLRNFYPCFQDKDIVEVVRCSECKHHPNNGGECDRSITHTGRDYVCEVNTYRYIGIDFCSYGERREE